MEKLSRLTKNSFASKDTNRAANAALVCHVAKRCLGEFFKKSFLKEIEIISFRDSVLFVSTPNSTYSQEIKLKEKDILDSLNKDLRSEIVENIRFRSKKLKS